MERMNPRVFLSGLRGLPDGLDNEIKEGESGLVTDDDDGGAAWGQGCVMAWLERGA